jgi:glutathione peroxidase
VTIETNKFKLIGHKMDIKVQTMLQRINPVLGRCWRACWVTGLLAVAGAGHVQAAAPSAACPALLNHTFDRLQDEKPQSLCQYAGKVVLVVNTASFCGFTGQYKGLEALHAKYKDRGLVVLGFPSNDFSQESGNNQQIADFCESTFGVKFPMFTKTQVTGDGAAPFFKQLTAQTGQRPRWNFHKYLIGRDGKAIDQYSSMTGPDSKALVSVIEKALKAQP